MKRQDQLLIRLGEECSEVAQRTSKAVLFTLEETQEGQKLNNSERLTEELNDLIGVMEMLIDEGFIPPVNREMIENKKVKVEKYIKYSEKCRK